MKNKEIKMFYSDLHLFEGLWVSVILAVALERHRKWVGGRISKILRHSGKSRGLHVRCDGYVVIADLLSLLEKDGIFMSDNDLVEFVHSDSKMRYGICGAFIRAHQGHSMRCVKLEHSATRFVLGGYMPCTVVYHGTTWTAWRKIKKKGLSRRGRTAIHCAIGLPGDAKVKSGMRCESECIIQVNMADAMSAGLVFYVSDNGVVLCEGPIHPRFLQLTE